MVTLHLIDDGSSGNLNECVNRDESTKDLKSVVGKKRSKSQTIIWLKNKFFESGCIVFEDDCKVHPIDKCFQTSLPSFDKFQLQSSIFAHNCNTVLGHLSFDHIIKNICSLRTAYVSKIARPILHHLMTDKRNMNIFNDPVDPVKLQLPQYFDIITTPMDLGTVKGKLRSGHYQSLKSCFDDIELVFTNAMRFNASDHAVHKLARDLLHEFRGEVDLTFDKCLKENERKNSHDCSLCSGSTCHLCGEKCLKFDPPKLSCQKCPQHIKRNDVYYISRDGSYVWCQKCYFSLPQVIVPVAVTTTTGSGGSDAADNNAAMVEGKENNLDIDTDDCSLVDPDGRSEGGTSRGGGSISLDRPALLKKHLLKRCADEEVAEPWVACDSCGHWYHQICALYNKLQEGIDTFSSEEDGIDQYFCCPFCILLFGCKDSAVDLNDSLTDVLSREACLELTDSLFANVVELSTEGNNTPVRGFHSVCSNESNLSIEINLSLSDVEDHDILHDHRDYRCNDSSSMFIDAINEPSPLLSFREGQSTALLHKFSMLSPSAHHPAFHHAAEDRDGHMVSAIDLVSTSSVIDSMSYCNDARDVKVKDMISKKLHKSFHGSSFRASSLQKTKLSNFLECLVKDLLSSNGFADVCDSITICMTSNRDHALDVPPPILENLCTADRDRLPARIGYYQKSVLLFQEIDGVDVCLFSLYVHEFDHACPAPNTSAVYIAYLDSVQYFRPVEARTMVQQEIVGGYLKWAQVRGFKHAFIWSCPPHRGDYFIFNGHPAHQRNPSREHLNAWYRSIVDRCTATGIVEKASNFWQEYFASYLKREVVHEERHAAKQSYVRSGKLLKRKAVMMTTDPTRRLDDIIAVRNDCSEDAQRRQQRQEEDQEQPPSVAVCPPIFENDYWVQQYMAIVHNHLHKSKSKRGRSRAVEQHSLVNQLKELLKGLMSRAEAKHFLQPVNPRELNIPTYFQVISDPMDLGTIRHKLIAYRYTTALDFVKDVRLTFANARVFNPPNHAVHVDAVYLQNKFEHSLNLFSKEHFTHYTYHQMDALLGQMVLEVGPTRKTGSKLESHRNNSNNNNNSSTVRFENEVDNDLKSLPSSEQRLLENSDPQQLKRRLQRIVSEDGSLCCASSSYSCTEHDDDGIDTPKRRRTLSDNFCPVDADIAQCDTDCADKSFYSNISSEENDIKIASQSLITTQEFSALLVNDNYVRQRFDRPSFGHRDAMGFVADLSKVMQKASDDLFVLKFHPYVEPQAQSSDAPSCATAAHRRPRGRASFLFKGQSSVSFAGGLRSLNAECQAMLSNLAAHRIATDNSDPDPTIKSPLADSRHTFLEMSQFKHLQFDSLRRAKHSSIMLLHYLQNPEAKSCRPLCCRCHSSITDIRWHCDQCVDFDICSRCYDCMSAPEQQQQLEHSQRISSDCPSSHRSSEPHSCIEPFVQYHSHLLTPFRVTFQ